jgi:2,3-bisphosphoglycerate-dependent phosphoglycerate mutase
MISSMNRLILLRHGQSEWNKRNLFTGWVDIPLSEEGIDEAFKAGDAIKNLPIDVIVTTTLIRAPTIQAKCLLCCTQEKVIWKKRDKSLAQRQKVM